MKLLLSVLFLLIVTVFTTCKKDGPSNSLPAVTQEGKNTVGFKVNGKIWTPYSECGFSNDPCGALSMQYNLPSFRAYYLGAYFKRDYKKDDNSDLFISTGPGVTISSTGNKYDSLVIEYTDYAVPGRLIAIYTQSYHPKGNFTVTKIDQAHQIISGTFEFTLYSATDSVVITDGRFDCKFYTCICNQ